MRSASLAPKAVARDARRDQHRLWRRGQLTSVAKMLVAISIDSRASPRAASVCSVGRERCGVEGGGPGPPRSVGNECGGRALIQVACALVWHCPTREQVTCEHGDVGTALVCAGMASRDPDGLPINVPRGPRGRASHPSSQCCVGRCVFLYHYSRVEEPAM